MILSGVGIFAFVYAMIEGNVKGWTSPTIIGLTILGLVLLVLLRAVGTARARPDDEARTLQDPQLLGRQRHRDRDLVRDARHLLPDDDLPSGCARLHSPIRAGLTMSPMSLTMMIAAPLAGRLTDRIGARWILFRRLR